MAAYQANYTGADSTDLSAYTSDSSHTHTKQSGDGAFVITSNALRATGAANTAFYTASYAPPSADYDIECEFNVQDVVNQTVNIGGRVETDEDGVWVGANGFVDEFRLYKTVGGVDTDIDLVAMSPGTRTIKMSFSGNNVEWFLDGVSQGTHSLSGDLSAAGLIGFGKFGEVAPEDSIRINTVTVTETSVPPITDAPEKLRIVQSNLRTR